MKNRLSNTVKKFLSPLLYFSFLFPTLGVIFLGITAIERVFGLHTVLGRMGDIDSFILLVASGTIFFYGGSAVTHAWEKIKRPSLLDHFRQSFLYYATFLVSLYLAYTLYTEFNGALLYAYYIIICSTSFFAILLNAFYLVQKVQIEEDNHPYRTL